MIYTIVHAYPLSTFASFPHSLIYTFILIFLNSEAFCSLFHNLTKFYSDRAGRKNSRPWVSLISPGTLHHPNPPLLSLRTRTKSSPLVRPYPLMLLDPLLLLKPLNNMSPLRSQCLTRCLAPRLRYKFQHRSGQRQMPWAKRRTSRRSLE